MMGQGSAKDQWMGCGQDGEDCEQRRHPATTADGYTYGHVGGRWDGVKSLRERLWVELRVERSWGDGARVSQGPMDGL